MGCTGTVNYGPVAFPRAGGTGRRQEAREALRREGAEVDLSSGSVRGQGDAGSVPPGAGRSARAPSDAHKPCFAVVLTAPTRKMVEELHMPSSAWKWTCPTSRAWVWLSPILGGCMVLTESRETSSCLLLVGSIVSAPGRAG